MKPGASLTVSQRALLIGRKPPNSDKNRSDPADCYTLFRDQRPTETPENTQRFYADHL